MEDGGPRIVLVRAGEEEDRRWTVEAAARESFKLGRGHGGVHGGHAVIRWRRRLIDEQFVGEIESRAR